MTPPRSTARAAAVRTAAAVLALSALGGCGIRATPVPVDAGPAPSRASCGGPGDRDAPRSEGTVRAEVFLVCDSSVVAVERSVRPSASDLGDGAARRLETARALLDQLRARPSPAESAAGFTSAVPTALRVRGPGPGDPDEALRLNRPPRALPPFALAQLVCTFAGTAAVDGNRSVVLGGPVGGPGGPPLRYACDSALRSSPEAARTAGAPL